MVDRSKHKEGKDILEAYQLAQRLQSMVDTNHPHSSVTTNRFHNVCDKVCVVAANEEEARA